MPASANSAARPAVLLDEPVFLPAESFFVRRVPLDPGAEPAGQIELALEAGAPFGLPQLYYGYLRTSDGTQALVFATHRRLFAAEAWDGASTVLPGFAALLGHPPAEMRIRTWQRPERLVVAAWDGAGELPAVVLARAIDPTNADAVREELLAEVTRRLGRSAAVEEFSGEVQIAPAKSGGLELTLAGGGGRKIVASVDPVALETMDVRDKAVLATRRAVQRRDRLLWRVLGGAAGAIVLCAVLELVLVAGGVLVRQQRAAEAQVAPEVERIQTAQALGTRIEEMSRRRLRPFEMLAVLNQARPAGVMFTRSTTVGQGSIEIEAETANADSPGAYETALRALPAIESLEVRDLRLRNGLTTFQLVATFREGTLAGVAGTGTGAGGQP